MPLHEEPQPAQNLGPRPLARRFDWAGLRATTYALDCYGAKPWRMDTTTYERARIHGESEPLKGSPPASPWAPDLTAE
ncbi:DUF2399 domain-containing protein [Nonomuraea sp. M3C6]|uniref:DUF2399 domain-containing protein n=1 Tax=Nonomuraea marmarensis TaxID=3351344 RepID=A0ABW7AUG7_9ACTN